MTTPSLAQAIGPVESRAYIIAREPASAPQIWILGPAIELRGAVITTFEGMKDVFDIYTIIFLALAVFIFLRLRSVLGQRTGRERPPPWRQWCGTCCGRRTD